MLIPDIERSVADMLLRPLFDNNQNMDMESTYFYGAEAGLGQSVKKSWHPGLMLGKTTVSVPEAAPEDYLFWHCDVSILASFP